MSTSETQECFVCKAQFTDLDLFWKHIYEVECEASNSADTTVAASTATVVSAPTTTTVNGTISSDCELENELLPPSKNIYSTVGAQDDSKSASNKLSKAQKRKKGNYTTKSLPDNSRQSSQVGNNATSGERQSMFPNPNSSSSLLSLTRLADTFKRNKPAIPYCDVCSIPLSSFASLEQHKIGRKHLRALDREIKNESNVSQPTSSNKANLGTCSVKVDVCPTRTASKSPGSLSDRFSQVPNLTIDSGSGGFWCIDCNLLLPSHTEFQVHRESFKHRSAAAWNQRGASVESSNSNPEDVYGYQKPDSSASLKDNLAPPGTSFSNDGRSHPNSVISPMPTDVKSIIRKLCLTQLLSLISDTDIRDATSPDVQVIQEAYSSCREELIRALSLKPKGIVTTHFDSTRPKYAPATKPDTTSFDRLLQSMTLLSWCRQLQLLD